MEPKKICSVCHTENRYDFTFCKNCGSKLQVSEQEPTANDAPVKTDVQPTEQTASPDNLSELEERATFIGKNGPAIAQKQLDKKMRFTKHGWNWAVFLFGLFLSLPFIWFFYRKMYNQGTKVLIASLAFFIAISGCVAGFISPIFEAVSVVIEPLAENDYSSYMNYTPMENNEFIEGFEDGFQEGYGYDLPDEVINEMTAKLTAKLSQMLICFLGAFLLNIGHLVYIILLSVYADNIYSNHCDRKIKRLKNISNCNPITLHNLGGTNTLAGVLSGIFGYIGISIISTLIVFAGMASLINAFISILNAM